MGSTPAGEKDRSGRGPAEAKSWERVLHDTRRAVLNLLEDLEEDRRAIQQAEREWRVAFDGVRDAIFLHDADLRIIRANRTYELLAGMPQSRFAGKRYWEVFPKQAGPLPGCLERKPIETEFEVGKAIYRSRAYAVEKEGRYLFSVHIMEDVTERKQMEERVRFLAQHDPLTMLPNRWLFVELLENELAQAQRNGRKLAVLFFDLDKFKNINDTLGHEVGDELLKEVATRIRRSIRRSDTVARIGGDEFNIILSDLERGEYAGEVAAQIVGRFRRPFLIHGQAITITTSIGISLYPEDSDTGEALLRYADMAMYEAKEQGRNTFRFYNPAINLRSQERMRIESSLRQALERDELRIAYQPKVDLRTGQLAGVEALVRWQHPELGLLAPDHFIPVAEESGLIALIDEWVLKTACTQLQTWLCNGAAPFCMSVNFSARQFQRADLMEVVSRVLEESCLLPEYLELELTESAIMSHIEQAIPAMRALAERGIHIAVDDFGTGYSSLNYLKRLPIERLKIDQSFVQDIATDPDDRAIVQAVTALAHNLNKRVIAEGVETEEQLVFLRTIGCDQAQGFLFHRPLWPEQLQALLSHGAE